MPDPRPDTADTVAYTVCVCGRWYPWPPPVRKTAEWGEIVPTRETVFCLMTRDGRVWDRLHGGYRPGEDREANMNFAARVMRRRAV
jgi:hypothetical protein